MKSLIALASLLAGLGSVSGQTPASIPLSDLGAKASAQYQGDGLSVASSPAGPLLRCVFQKLEGRVAEDGLWLCSTAESHSGSKFRITACAVGRDRHAFQSVLPPRGVVSLVGNLARYERAGLTEEYSVSVNGVRQDFVVTERPEGKGDLCVELTLTGARAEAATYGAKLILDGSGRELAYSRLRVVDATGRELAAHLDVLAADRLAVQVADAAAAYPVRIDPTFSDADWVSLSDLAGANNTVNAIAVDGGGNVYFGGSFTLIGTVAANRVARWDGSTWSALGSGLNATVSALAVSGTTLYAGGFFTTAGGMPANRIAKWDTSSSTWSALNLGMNSSVLALAASGNDLYAGGDFTIASNASPAFVMVNRVAKWDDTSGTWSALGAGVNNTVSALAVNATDLYVGGTFAFATNSGPAAVMVNRIARWNFSGGAWSALGAGMSGNVSALALNATDLFVGGAFITATNVGGASVIAPRVAKWNFVATAWSGFGFGVNNTVSALAISGTDLFVGGAFTAATNPGGGTNANIVAFRLAKWNGTEWSRVGLGVNNTVLALAMRGSDLVAGGSFTSVTNAGGTSVVALRLAKWSDPAWSVIGSGMNNSVRALLVNGTDVYAGGDFTTARGVSANRVAKWDGSSWSALGLGVSGGVGSVRSLAKVGDYLYVGGLFTTAGGIFSQGFAKWHIPTSTWSPVGLGMAGSALALAASGTDLYVGGDFGFVTNPGPTAVMVNRIVKLDTVSSTWSALGPGLTNHAPGGFVDALALNGTDLFVGGEFTRAATLAVTNIARWDAAASAWSPLGPGLRGPVYALAMMGTDLYAGGDFTITNYVSGTSPTFLNAYVGQNLVRWDGVQWSPLIPAGTPDLPTHGVNLGVYGVNLPA